MNYIKALKIYNDRKGDKNEWCVYKKGTSEYLEVIKIMKEYKEKAKEELEKPLKEKALNTINNAIKIKKAKEELEKLKAKKEEEKALNTINNAIKIKKAKEELENLKAKKEDENNQLFKIINDQYKNINKINFVQLKDDINTDENTLNKNPRLIKIKKSIIDNYKKFDIYRNELKLYFEILINACNNYIKIYKNKFNYIFLYFAKNIEDSYKSGIISLYLKKKIGFRYIDYEYNDEFNSYIIKILDKKIENGKNTHIYDQVEEYRKTKRIYPTLIKEVFDEVEKFIYDFLNQNNYNNIQDYYNKFKGLYADINLYQKFIDYYNNFFKKDNILVEDFIIDIEDYIDIKMILNFNKNYLLKEKEENLKVKKEELEKLKAKKEEEENLKVKKEELEKLKAKKEEEENLKVKKEEENKNPDLNKIIEIPEKSKNITTNEYIEIRDNINRDIEKYLPIYLPLFNINDLLTLMGFTREDIKLLNIFLTPLKNAEQLIDYSFIMQEYTNSKNYNKNVIYDILEPTAGTGNIISELININPEAYRIDAIEINKTLYNIGKARFKNFNNINWYNKSFFDFKPNKKYDYIFMNPPFNINIKGKRILDIDFINECYKLLKDDGKICAIISNSYKKRKEPKFKKFKEFIEDYGSEYELNDGFKRDKTMMKEMETKVDMMIIIIDKQEDIESIF